MFQTLHALCMHFTRRHFNGVWSEFGCADVIVIARHMARIDGDTQSYFWDVMDTVGGSIVNGFLTTRFPICLFVLLLGTLSSQMDLLPLSSVPLQKP